MERLTRLDEFGSALLALDRIGWRTAGRGGGRANAIASG